MDGIYDAMALVDSLDLSMSFSVSFIWFGGTDSQVAQPFDIYDENFNAIESGVISIATANHVPEPTTLLVFL
ncbi:MAG: hypothetical protein MI892_12585 [Desulfobacterales bacterium]|nr:hypothetical protein [Desulfobacterales bacterium]